VEAQVYDRPVYRTQRMLYPTLASPFRVGGYEALFAGLVIVNLAAVAFGTYAAARLAVVRGASPLFGLAFALNPMVIVATLMDLSDALGLAMLLGTLLALREDRHRAALLFAVGAVLTKEVYLLPLAAVALLSTRDLPVRRRVELIAAPLAAAGTWAMYVRWRFHWAPTNVRELSTHPFAGVAEAYRTEWSLVHDWTNAIVAGAVLVIGGIVVVRWCLRRSLELTAALPFALLMPLVSGGVLALWTNSIRVFGPVLTLLVIDWYAQDQARVPAPTPPRAAIPLPV
jgi:hypothetical protein